MAFRGLDLGNLSAALSLTGGDPSLADRLREQQAVAPAAPEASPSIVPPSANQALELTGSKYRVPQYEPPPPRRDMGPPSRAPAPAPMAPASEAGPPSMAQPAEVAPAPAPTPQVVDHRASAKSMQNQLTGNTNEAIQNQLDMGDVKSARDAQQSDIYGQAKEEGREGLDAAKLRRDEAYKRKDENSKAAYNALEDMRTALGNPPDQTKGKVLQIIGAMLSAHGGGGGAGAAAGIGLSMLGKSMGGDVEAWQRGIAGNDHIRKSFLEMNEAEDQGTDAELRHEQKISELAAGTYLNALKQVEEGAGSHEEKLAAKDLAAGIENKFLLHWLDVKQRQAAAGAANKYEKMTIELLAGLEASGQLPKAGRNVLESKYKFEQGARKGEADIGKTEADAAESIAKANAKAGGAENGIVHVGGVPYVASSPVEKGALTKFTEQSVALGGVQSDLAKLYQIRARNEGKTLNDANDVRDAKLLINGLTDKLSNFYGGGAAGEAAAERTLSSIADPTDVALRGDPKTVYASISKNLQDSMLSGLQGAGFKPRAAAPAQPTATSSPETQPSAAPAPSSGGAVRLYRQDGSQTGPLDPAKARTLLDSGKFFSAPQPAPSPDAMANASDADYEEQVRRSQGYQ